MNIQLPRFCKTFLTAKEFINKEQGIKYNFCQSLGQHLMPLGAFQFSSYMYLVRFLTILSSSIFSLSTEFSTLVAATKLRIFWNCLLCHPRFLKMLSPSLCIAVYLIFQIRSIIFDVYSPKKYCSWQLQISLLTSAPSLGPYSLNFILVLF